MLLPDHRDGSRGARSTPEGGSSPGPGPGGLVFRPDPAEFAALAKEHTIVPVWCEVVADTLTPVACFANVVGEGDGFLFESVEGGERWGRYSFVGRRPLATLTARGRTVETTGRLDLERSDDGILAAVEGLVARFRSPVLAGLPPLHGGLVGYLGYDVVREVERPPGPAARRPRPSRRRVGGDRAVLPRSTTGASASSWSTTWWCPRHPTVSSTSWR